MIIFRSIAFYLSVAGIIAAIVLIRINNNPHQEVAQVQTPAINPYLNVIAAAGIVESSDRNISLGVPQAGIVNKIFVKVSDDVKQGDPLFQLDPSELEAQLLIQKANVRVAEATLARQKDQLNRLQSVSDPRAVSKDDLQTKENDVKVAEAQLHAAIAQVEQTNLLIARLTVKAPRDGQILQNNIREGEYISSTSSLPAMLLGDLNHLQVRVDIDEQNACRFLPQQPALAYLKNNTKVSIPLKFDLVEPYVIPKRSLTGLSDERVDTRVLQVIYSFDIPKDMKIFVGQQVDIFIDTDPKEMSSL